MVEHADVDVVGRRAFAGSASYGVAHSPGERGTASLNRQVDVVRRRAFARSASYGVAQSPGHSSSEPFDMPVLIWSMTAESARVVTSPTSRFSATSRSS